MTDRPLASVALFCGSSTGVQPQWVEAAAAFGRILAQARVRLVYGGGGLGLMGACARAVVAGGGRVLGVIPEFLRLPEVAYEEAELVVVGSMHERKATMFQEADGFVVLPGGVGTLEEIIEILSWTRLGLHAKPVVFLNSGGYWTPLFELIEHTVREGFTPSQFRGAFAQVERVEDILPALASLAARAGERPRIPLTVT
jgi:uncharacterized protein (TIGR00730 family)